MLPQKTESKTAFHCLFVLYSEARCLGRSWGPHAPAPEAPLVCAPGSSSSSAGRRRTPPAGFWQSCARDSRCAQRRSRGGGRARGLGGPNQRASRRGRARAAQSGPSAPRLQGAPGVTNARSRGERRGEPAWAATRPLEAPEGARQRCPRGETRPRREARCQALLMKCIVPHWAPKAVSGAVDALVGTFQNG